MKSQHAEATIFPFQETSVWVKLNLNVKAKVHSSQRALQVTLIFLCLTLILPLGRTWKPKRQRGKQRGLGPFPGLLKSEATAWEERQQGPVSLGLPRRINTYTHVLHTCV